MGPTLVIHGIPWIPPHSKIFHVVSIVGVMPLGTRASMASQIAQNALGTRIWEANNDSGAGWAAWACKTGRGYAVAMLWLCGGYAAAMRWLCGRDWTNTPSTLLSLDQLSLMVA